MTDATLTSLSTSESNTSDPDKVMVLAVTFSTDSTLPPCVAFLVIAFVSGASNIRITLPTSIPSANQLPPSLRIIWSALFSWCKKSTVVEIKSLSK